MNLIQKTTLALFALVLIQLPTQAQTFINYTDADGLLHNSVNGVSVATNGDVWFGTLQGVSVFDGVNWSSHTTATDSGLVDNDITAVQCLSNGEVWVGSNFGVSHYNGSWTTYTEADGLGDNKVNFIEEGPSGAIWFGTSDGLSIFNNGWTNYGLSEGLPFGGINHVAFDSNGDAWLSGGLGGAIHFDGVNFTIYTTADGLVSDKVRSIGIDAQNNKWIGTASGVTVLGSTNQLVENHTGLLTLPPPDTLNPVEDVLIDANNKPWVGVYVDYLLTEGGISQYNGIGWAEFQTADGLAGPYVRRMDIDANGDIWIVTSTGVSHFVNPPNSVTEVAAKETFQIYPNPAADQFVLQLSPSSEVSQVHVFNAAMQQMRSIPVNRMNTIRVDAANLATGVYFVQVGSSVQKLIIR